MSQFNLFKSPQFLDEGITPAAKEIGKTLGNIFYAVFSPVNYNVEKLKIKQAENLKKYEQDIKSELSKIPEQQLIEPKLSLVGPALEASKYYIEEEEIRKMFAKLTASSMNKELISYSHPSFIEIIKQINSIEAHVIQYLARNSFLPFVKLNYKGINQSTTLFPIIEPYTKINDLDADYYTMTSSLKNLQRLGIIRFVDTQFSTDQPIVDTILKDNVFDDYHEITNYLHSQNRSLENGTMEIESGNIFLTTYGTRFAKVCL